MFSPMRDPTLMNVKAPVTDSTSAISTGSYHVWAQSEVITKPPTPLTLITRFHRSFRLAALAGAGCFAVACADNGPTAPSRLASVDQVAASHNGDDDSGKKAKKTHVSVLTRTQALSHDYVVSGDIGPAGGTLDIDAAGGSITFPPNAVSTTIRITMRALAGNAVAYEFEPHGLIFAVQPTLQQKLDVTNWKKGPKSGIEGVYYADPTTLDVNMAEADADEFFVTNTKGDKTLSFSIPHFSGYLVSSARR